MAIFVFGPGTNSYYINNGLQSFWSNIPDQLANILQNDVRFRTDNILSLALFPDGGHYLVAKDGCYDYVSLPPIIKATMDFASFKFENVFWIQFDGSDLSRNVVARRDNALCPKNLPTALLVAAFEEAFTVCTTISLGYNATWALGCDSKRRAAYCNVNAPELKRKICHPDRLHVPGKTLKHVVLSPYSEQYVFVEYNDGSTDYMLPPAWHSTVDQIMNAPQFSTGSVPAFTASISGANIGFAFVNEVLTGAGVSPAVGAAPLKRPATVANADYDDNTKGLKEAFL